LLTEKLKFMEAQTYITTNKEHDQVNIMVRTLDWIYDKSVDPGIKRIYSAYDLAENYTQKFKNTEDAISSMVNWQTAKCATSGFLTGVGGLITLPITIPANIASVLFVQIRMLVAIAIMRGFDPRSDQVKSLVYICLTGNAASNLAKSFGVQFGEKLTQASIKKISGTVLIKINQLVGFRFITKNGTKGLINLGKSVPLVGGLIGGTFDAGTTRIIAKTARKLFITEETLLAEPAVLANPIMTV
jgi:hypothetical protein